MKWRLLSLVAAATLTLGLTEQADARGGLGAAGFRGPGIARPMGVGGVGMRYHPAVGYYRPYGAAYGVGYPYPPYGPAPYYPYYNPYYNPAERVHHINLGHGIQYNY